jgi:hypothetical protein
MSEPTASPAGPASVEAPTGDDLLAVPALGDALLVGDGTGEFMADFGDELFVEEPAYEPILVGDGSGTLQID